MKIILIFSHLFKRANFFITLMIITFYFPFAEACPSGSSVSSCLGLSDSSCNDSYLVNGYTWTQCFWTGKSCENGSEGAYCQGSGESSCSGLGATSSTCASYYLKTASPPIQCKWNGSYCSDGGGDCCLMD